jgi:hypothetical protein
MQKWRLALCKVDWLKISSFTGLLRLKPTTFGVAQTMTYHALG